MNARIRCRPRGTASWLVPAVALTALLITSAGVSGRAVAAVASPLAARAADRKEELTRRARAILEADYRGQREVLARLEREMRDGGSTDHPAAWAYWQGFALWRRAINGFNESPLPADLKDDLTAAVACFRTSLAADSLFVDADIALLGCLSNLVYLAGTDSTARATLIRDAGSPGRSIRTRGMDNPRAFWILGGLQAFAPPPAGGNLEKAADLYHRGLAAARRESLAGTDPWQPAWGAPELLMSLAYLYSQGPLQNPSLARAYAEGALAAVPHWHYVREILLPRIEAPPPATTPK